MSEEPNLGEVVALTDQETADLAEAHEAWLRRPSDVRGAQTFTSTLNRMLEAHDFVLYTGSITVGIDGRVFLGLRRRPGGGVEPLTESGVQQIIRELAETAEIGRRVHPHLLRHSFITDRLNRRMSPIHLKEMVGHKSMTMIDRVYSHIKPADVYEEMARSEGR